MRMVISPEALFTSLHCSDFEWATGNIMNTLKQQYCAIIGDINKSRTLERRARAQEKFKEAVAAINKEFKNDIASKFLITLGDEFQGLLKTPARSYHIVRRFQELTEPIVLPSVSESVHSPRRSISKKRSGWMENAFTARAMPFNKRKTRRKSWCLILPILPPFWWMPSLLR
jgi:hypothetical protein